MALFRSTLFSHGRPLRMVRSLGVAFLASISCSVGSGEGWLVAELNMPTCEDFPAKYDMQPNFFGAVSFGGQLQIRVQNGGDTQEYTDSLTISVRDIETIHASKLNTPIEVQLERPPGSLPSVPYPFVRMSLSLRKSCGKPRIYPIGDPQIVLHATRGTMTFQSILHGDITSRDTASKRIEGSFDVYVEDPRQPLDAPNRFGGRVRGGFKFFYQKGGPAQPFQ